MTAAPETSVMRSATTGEPITVVERRNRLGIWLCIVSDITGTVALLIAYAYLWSLNVGGGWAPPNDAYAAPVPFWFIVLGFALAATLMWWGVRGIRAGDAKRMATAAALSSLIVLVTFVAQVWQLSTFPFGVSDGAYASATFWLALSAAFHLFTVFFLTTAVLGRTRKGLISPANPYHAHLVAMFMTWTVIAAFLGALLATTMTDSPNSKSPAFGGFSNEAAAPSSSASPAASSSASPAASPAASPSASPGS
jgi:hypothetical protein